MENSGKIATPGSAANNTLYQRVAGINGLGRMPFGGESLAPEQVKLSRAWIDQGAEIPETAPATAQAVKTHWGFIASVRPPVPQVVHQGWVRNPIDSFILARLEKEGLSPSAPADRRQHRAFHDRAAHCQEFSSAHLDCFFHVHPS